MDRFVALYRGINVGGKNAVKMQALCAMHEALGHCQVASYIQSGNLVFAAKGSLEAVTRGIAARFVKEFGFAAHVVLVKSTRWSSILRENPYSKLAAALPKTVHVGISNGSPSQAGLRALLERTGGNEAFTVKGDVVYLHAPDGFGTSRFAAGMERACGVPLTVRNWRTVEAIGRLLDP
jgi:uncharacterized protein (DUF1697 family)